MQTPYDADYFLRGQATGKSLYSDYRWLPNLTVPMVRTFIDHLQMDRTDTVLDFGCSRGYVVKAFLQLGLDAEGIDISDWAIENCDPDVKGKVRLDEQPRREYDWIIAKDVMEHLSPHYVAEMLGKFEECARAGVFLVVPLSAEIDQPYVVPDYEKDVTHQVRWPLWKWIHAVDAAFGLEWEVSARYRIEGIKDNYAQWPKGNGFITLRRI